MNKSEGKHLWRFVFRSRRMSEHDLKRYQNMLEEIRKETEGDAALRAQYKPVNEERNVFVKFGDFKCMEKHANEQLAHGWRLFWNPNETSDSDLLSFLDNNCVEAEFKVKSKLIQKRIVDEFGNYFHLIDNEEEGDEAKNFGDWKRDDKFYRKVNDDHYEVVNKFYELQ